MTDIIAKNIKHYRKKLGLTQEALGARLGYSVKSISKWESGNGTPPTVMLPQLARALNIDINLLFQEKENELLYLGIDGGGTKTDFALADSSGRMIKKLCLGSSNPSDIGFPAACDRIKFGIMEICSNHPKSCISVFAGLAGGSTVGIHAQIGQFLNGFGFAHVGHGSDARNAIAAGLGESDGIVVILGTGSATFAQYRKKQYRVGGYGYLFGDAGSGFAFGRDAILSALCFEDGSGTDTLIFEKIKKKMQKSSVLDGLGSFYELGKRSIAEYASCLFDAYDEGDVEAERILISNLEVIARSIRGAAKHFPPTLTSIPVILCGGIATTYKKTILPILSMQLVGDIPHFEISICKRKMVEGALLLAGAPNNIT